MRAAGNTMDAPWRIEMLGWLRAMEADRVVTRFRTHKTGALLAYLAYHGHRSHSRETLIELFWPEGDPRAGSASLRKALSSLRQQLEPPAMPPGAVLLANRASVQLNPAAYTLDVEQFETALHAANQAHGTAEQVQQLTAAVALYRGELLPGYFEDWILPEQQRLAEAFLQAIHHLIQHLEQAGDLHEAAQWARRAVAADPLREQGHHEVIRLLAAGGQVEAALRQYHELERLMAQELAAAPALEIQTLVAELKRGDRRLVLLSHGETQRPRRGDGPAHQDEGAVRVATGSNYPETAPGETETILSPSSPRAPWAPTGQMPLQLTRFFGREEEMARLEEMLLGETGSVIAGSSAKGLPADTRRMADQGARTSPPAARLVTLTGPGGSGKTRLALAVTAHWRDRSNGAVWFVPLLALADPRLILDKILTTLSLPRSPQVEPLEQVVAMLSSTDARRALATRALTEGGCGCPSIRPVLLLLDNFEHLVEGGAGLVRVLLERVEGLTVLVTSRQRLGLPGEREFPVLPLPVPPVPGGEDRGARRGSDARHPIPEALIDCASVRLFVDRAQAVRPDFQLTRANAAGVAALCARLEGLPLALELAAARSALLTPQQMLARLSHRFELLVTRQRVADVRHRSLRATVEWSCHLLPSGLQQFFARLSIFRGSWSLEAAATVCEAAAVLENLGQLRECSLVQTEEADGEMRFRLLETLREYGAEQLAPEEQVTLARRHAEFFLALAERAEPELLDAEPAAWLDRLEREHDNLRAALEWCVASREAEVGLRLGGSLREFWEVRGYVAEGGERLARLLALPEASPRTAARAKALYGAGVLTAYQGSLEPARSNFEESLTIWKEHGSKQGMALALHGLAGAASFQGDDGAARSRHEESLALRRESGDKPGICSSLQNLAHLAFRHGDLGTARRLYEESLAIWRELGHRWGMTFPLHGLADVARAQGNDDRARSLQEEILAIRREVGHKWGIGMSLTSLGSLALRQEDDEAARAFFEESQTIWRELGNGKSLVFALHSLGLIAQRQGDGPRAAALWRECLALPRAPGDRRGVAECLDGLAGVAAARRQYHRSARLLAAAEALREANSTAVEAGKRAAHDRHLALARAGMGEAAFAAAWAEGRELPLEQAVAAALRDE